MSAGNWSRGQAYENESSCCSRTLYQPMSCTSSQPTVTKHRNNHLACCVIETDKIVPINSEMYKFKTVNSLLQAIGKDEPVWAIGRSASEWDMHKSRTQSTTCCRHRPTEALVENIAVCWWCASVSGHPALARAIQPWHVKHYNSTWNCFLHFGFGLLF